MGFLGSFFLQHEALPSAEGALFVAVAASGEDQEGHDGDEGGDRHQDDAPPTVTHVGPVDEPGLFGDLDPVVAGFALIVVADDSEDDENERDGRDDARYDVPGELLLADFLFLGFTHNETNTRRFPLKGEEKFLGFGQTGLRIDFQRERRIGADARGGGSRFLGGDGGRIGLGFFGVFLGLGDKGLHRRDIGVAEGVILSVLPEIILRDTQETLDNLNDLKTEKSNISQKEMERLHDIAETASTIVQDAYAVRRVLTEAMES